MDQAQAKQQIVERIKQATNILVTVSNNPSVDQLAACIGLTLLLNKMEKHATALFSGQVPSTLQFLQPEKTIEKNTDSLQDFIISLDKNKADKLRYKVEDQVVRIFITPYRSSISEKDLVFSHGDFNVQLVLALGIKERSQLDQSISAHGRILHDAAVVSINAATGTASQLGQINWQDPTASSLCEMIVSISEALGANLIDNQMATAFLTGLVAETDRFSNKRTSPKVMTMSAQLMAAGANQQLIVSKLEPPAPPPPPPKPPSPPAAKPEPKAQVKLPELPKTPPPNKDGSLSISHDKGKSSGMEIEVNPNEIRIDKQGNLIGPDYNDTKKKDDPKKTDKDKQEKPEDKSPPEPPAPEPLPPPPVIPESPAAPPPTEAPSFPPLPPEPSNKIVPDRKTPESPATGQIHALMSPNNRPTMSAPFTADMQAEWIDPYNSVSMDPLTERNTGSGLLQRPQTFDPTTSASSASEAPATGAQPVGIDSARDAVQNALSAAPFDPAAAGPVAALNAQPIGPELHDTSTDPNATPSLTLPSNGNGSLGTVAPTAPPTDTQDSLAPPPVPPPLPLGSNPGAIMPNNPTYQPPSET